MNSKNLELCFLTIPEAAKLIKSRELSPVELVSAFLERIGKVDPIIKSYITILSDRVMEEAKIAETEISAGRYKGLLHGIPLAHKDLYDTKGIRTTAQSKVYEKRVPNIDSTVIERLNRAGALMLGKLSMFEFAAGGPETSIFDYSRNPWNTDYITGGSSSGSAAAVAASLCMGSMGSDTGGSVRGPAAACGIVGLKPTYGRVSRYGVIPISWSLDYCGPMTWSVEDNAVMLQAIAGFDENDPTTSRSNVPDYMESLTGDIKGMTIGVPKHFCFDRNAGDMDPETIDACEKALVDLEALGANVEEIHIESLEYANIANNVICMTEGFAYHLSGFKGQPENYGENFIKHLYTGGLYSSNDYIQAQRVRAKITREFTRVLSKVDVIVTPTSPRPAWPFGENPAEGALISERSFYAPYNQTGMPAISVPCGFNANGMPIGLQFASGAFEESTIFRIAHAYQQYAEWYKCRPQI